jgi:iron complex outermembrane receptor protein
VFPPYKTKQQEVGLKMDLNGFATTLSLFQIKRPSAYTDPVTSVYSFGGEQRNRGLELGFFGEPLRGLRLMGGLAYTQAKLTKTAGGVNQGKQATAFPRWQGKLGVEWDVPAVAGLTLTGNAISMSRQYINADNSLWVPGRTVFDLGARYSMQVAQRPVTLRAAVQNVTNKRYWAGSLFNGPGAPRAVLLSATVDF